MAEKLLKARVKLRTVDDNWMNDNEFSEVLLKGEHLYNSDLRLFKVGNGEDTIGDLSYNNAEHAYEADQASKADTATSATRLSAAAGSATQPVYFDASGNATPIGYTVAKSVPADAKFTDTTYNVATSTTLGLVKSGTDITVDASGNVSVNDDSHNHIISNIDGLSDSLNGKADKSHTHDYIPTSQKGAKNGVATLGDNGLIPTSQLPSYVDDVLEYAGKSNFPSSGETGKIYVDTNTNLTYRWSGSGYVEISPSLALGETSSTAYAGSKGAALATEVANIKSGTTVVGKATKDSKNQDIADTYIKGLSVSGKVITYTKGDGDTGTITTQDTNTSHAHGAGVGLSISGSGGTSGTTTYTLKQAAAAEIGGIKVSSVNSSAVSVNGESTTAGRYYPIELNSDGKAIVNVPWTDTHQDISGKLDKTSVAGTSGTIPKFTGANSVGNSSITQSSANDITIGGKLIVKSSGSTSQNSYNEGIRVLPAANGWSELFFSNDNSTSSNHEKGWILGKRGANGAVSGSAGDFTIECNGSNGGGLTLYANGNKPRWKNNELAYKSEIPGAATTSAAGLLSAADKTKLDGIATGANNYTLTLSEINSKISGNQITPGSIKVGGCTIAYDSTTPSITFSFT